MYELLMIIMCAIIIPVNSILVVIYLRQSFIAGTETNNLWAIVIVCIEFGIFFDCFKTLSFIILRSLDYNVLVIGFVVKTALLLLALIVMIRMTLIYNEQLDLKLKHGRNLQIFFIAIFIILSFFNIGTNYNIGNVEFNNPVLLMNPVIYYLSIIFFIPLGILMLVKTKPVLAEIRDKKLKRQFFAHLIFLTLLILERYFYNVAYYFGYFNYVFVILGDLISNLVITTGYLIVILRDPSMLDTISIHFSVKSFYVIKDNGQTIFSYHFKEENQGFLTREELMLGGFIYTIASGLSHSLKTDEKVKKIKIKETIVLLEYGKNIFGVLVASEISQLIQVKFDKLMQKFEDSYKTELEEWSGEISKFDIKKIDKWIEEIFKY